MSMLTAFIELTNRLLHPAPDLSHLSAEQQLALIEAKASTIVDTESLLTHLRRSKATGKPLTVKFGIDPTGPQMHLGHAVVLLALRLFRRMGHHVAFVIGDFTAMIGDPSGRSKQRVALTAEQVAENMRTYDAQASRVINLYDAGVSRSMNSSWMRQLALGDWVQILRRVSLGELLQREDFRTRLEQRQGLSIAELEYALFMAYDSVVLKPDIEVGGMDQYLNLHMCRRLMQLFDQRPEDLIVFALLPGTSGERDEEGRLAKMSKSLNNYIPIDTPPSDLYGRVMAIPDEVMWVWYRQLTDIDESELETLRDWVSAGQVHPKDAKHSLAAILVATLNGFDDQVVRTAAHDFRAKFEADAVSAADQSLQIQPVGDLLTTLANAAGRSKTEIRRLVAQRAVRVLSRNEFVPLDSDLLTQPGETFRGWHLRLGKRQFFVIR